VSGRQRAPALTVVEETAPVPAKVPPALTVTPIDVSIEPSRSAHRH